MKIKEIVNVVNKGMLNATGHSLPEEEYYKFFKFKKSVRNIYENFSNSEADLLKDMGITSEDIKQIDDRVLITPRKADGSLDTERLNKYYKAIQSLLNEDVELEITDKIPVKYYKNIYDENHKEIDGKNVDIFSSNIVEDFIIDNLFE